MITRRGLLLGVLAASTAPAFARSQSLMPVRSLSSGLLVPNVDIYTGPPHFYLNSFVADHD